MLHTTIGDCLLLTLLLLLLVCCVNGVKDTKQNAKAIITQPWTLCPGYTPSSLPPNVLIECNTALVPLDYAFPLSDGNQIPITLARVRPARLDPALAKAHIWMLSGSALFIEDVSVNGFDGLGLLGSSVVVYSLDRRGSVLGVFDCPNATASGDISDCSAEVDVRYGPDYRNNFTITNAARDIDVMIHLLSSDLGIPFHIHGLSIGSYVVQRYLQLRTVDPVTITLEGVVASGVGWTSNVEATQTSVARIVMAQCASDDFCAGQFNGVDPYDVMVQVFQTLRDHPEQSCFAKMVGGAQFLPPRVHRFLSSLFAAMVNRPLKANMLPALVHLFYRCNDKDMARFPFTPYIKAYVDSADSMSQPMVGYMEAGEVFADGTIPLSHLRDMVDQLPAGSGVSWNLGRFAQVWPKPPLDHFYKVLPDTGTIPVLVLNGALDSQSSLAWASWLAHNLSTTNPNVHLIALPNTGHQAILRNSPTLSSSVPCAMSIWSSFVLSSGKQLDTSCIKNIVPFDFQFTIPQVHDQVLAWFGTDDIWSQDPSSRSPF